MPKHQLAREASEGRVDGGDQEVDMLHFQCSVLLSGFTLAIRIPMIRGGAANPSGSSSVMSFLSVDVLLL